MIVTSGRMLVLSFARRAFLAVGTVGPVDLCRRALMTGELPRQRGVRPHLHVTFTAATMRGEPGAAHGRTSTGDRAFIADPAP